MGKGKKSSLSAWGAFLVASVVAISIQGSSVANASTSLRPSQTLAAPSFLKQVLGQTESGARKIVSAHAGYVTLILSADGVHYHQPMITPKNAPHMVELTLVHGRVTAATLASEIR